MRRQRRHAFHRAGLEHDFADVDISPAVRPDAVRRDEIAGQDRISSPICETMYASGSQTMTRAMGEWPSGG